MVAKKRKLVKPKPKATRTRIKDADFANKPKRKK